MQFALGIRHHDGTPPTVFAYVAADAPDARITGITSAGDDLLFTLACNALVDESFDHETPTPLLVSLGVAGRDATVHRVTVDGRLIGWRREFDATTPSLS